MRQRSIRAALVAGSLAALALAPSAFADTTQTDLASPVVNPVWGQPVTVTATVTNTTTPASQPTGRVQFKVDGVNAGPPVALAAGTATLSRSDLAIGAHSIDAAFTGDAPFDVSAATPLHRTVAKSGVSVQETISPDPSVAGQSADYVAHVRARSPGAGAPTGSVVFSDDGGPFASAELTAGTATVNLPSGAGGFNVTASYSGDDHFNPGSQTIGQTVTQAATATTLTSSASIVKPGQEVDLTAMVAVQPPGAVPTFGSLQFTAEGDPIGDPIPLGGNAGVIVTVTAPTAPGTYAVGVAYSGDDNTTASTAAPVQITVPEGRGTKDQLKAMGKGLMSALRKRGFAALAGTAEKFSSTSAGVLTQEIDSPKARASKAKKPIQVSKARVRFNGPGVGALKLKLTAAGKRAIRKAKSLRIAIVTTYEPVAGTAVRVVQRLTVKAKRGGKVAVTDSDWAVRGANRIGPKLGRLHGRS